MSAKTRSNILLFITAAIWGAGIIAQKSGMEYIEPFTYSGIRTLIAGLVLIPVVLIMGKNKKNIAEPRDVKLVEKENKTLLLGGILCGLALFAATSLQQFGISFTTAGKTGFITTLYVVIVPILSIAIGKKLRKIIWICVAMGAVGLYLLCMTDDSFRLQPGDALVLLCAVAFSVHIMIIDYFSPKVDGVKLSCIQFLLTGVLGIICMFVFEEPHIEAILDCWIPIIYAGALSGGIGYTLQIIAQKHAEPTVASLIMSLESVFAVVLGALVLHESMTSRELAGCVVIFAAVIIAQLPSRKQERL